MQRGQARLVVLAPCECKKDVAGEKEKGEGRRDQAEYGARWGLGNVIARVGM